MVGLTIALGVILTNWNAPYNDFPLREAVASPLLFAGIAAGYVAILIPVMLVFLFGVRLLSKRLAVPNVALLGLVGLWALAIIAAGIITVKVVGEYFEYTRMSPDYQVETRTIQAAPFTAISAYGQNVTIKNGDEQKVEISGRAADLESAIVEVQDGTLLVSEKDEHGRLCIFCGDREPEIIVTTPDLATIYAQNATIRFEDYADESLAIELAGGALRGALTSPALHITGDGGSLRMDIAVGTLSVDVEDLTATLDGTVENAELTLLHTYVEAQSLTITNATLNPRSSTLFLHVTGTLNETPDDRSTVRVTGNPTRPE
jgi:hypothetical protein